MTAGQIVIIQNIHTIDFQYHELPNFDSGNYLHCYHPLDLVYCYTTPTQNSSPYGIIADSRGDAGYAALTGNKIGRVDPETGEITGSTLRQRMTADLANSNRQQGKAVVH
jgi:hypothetical protein